MKLWSVHVTKMKKIICLGFFLFSLLGFAQETLFIVASDSIPPYVMGNEPLAKELPGLQVEIVDQAFARVNMKTRWKTMPNNRILLEYTKKDEVDAALNLRAIDTKVEHFDSDEVVSYRNCVIGPASLAKNWRVNLSQYKILGFQRARDIFSSLLGTVNLPLYNEVPSQKTIAYHAVNGRVDLILSDALVFAYYATTYFGPQYAQSNLRCLQELPLVRTLGFKNEAHRDAFNRGLKAIKSDGTYQRLIRKYRDRFSMLTQLKSSLEDDLIFIIASRY